MEHVSLAADSSVVCVVQARLTSSRLPGKVMMPISEEHTVISALLMRLSLSVRIAKIIVAIPDNGANSSLGSYLNSLGYETYFGDEYDVQSRFIDACSKNPPEWLVRITGDCPLIDPQLVDEVIGVALESDSDYCSNTSPPTFPDGLDVEVFKYQALLDARGLQAGSLDIEHVTWSLRESGQFVTKNFVNHEDLSSLRWTVDSLEDLQRIKNSLPPDFIRMGWRELASTSLGRMNFREVRNAGMGLSSGQKVWGRAKNVIPGGTMLLSKRPDMFLPDYWPTYYSKARGIEVWDLDGNRFVDFSTMSVGACSLGYGNNSVDSAVKSSIDDGVMSTLNSPHEVTLAERLVALHPWASMVRFARSGGEANSIATRIARASTGKDKIAICGYHGWHDWYLAANLDTDKNLDGHLLPGLAPRGVPRGLVGTTVPFRYNDVNSLKELLDTGEFAAVQMEVSRNFGPQNLFLENVRQLCDDYGVVLIFDECTSGFRETFGGLHLKFGVYPDLAMFGKALGNGYAVSAVIGTEDVMQAAQTTFISSTFWTERLGPAAALATLDEMNRLKSWESLPKFGAKVKEVWRSAFDKYGLEYDVSGLDALPSFTLNYSHWPVLKTLLTQEMLDRGYLAAASFYASALHSIDEIEKYQDAFCDSVETLANNFDETQALSLLRGRVAENGFRRLN